MALYKTIADWLAAQSLSTTVFIFRGITLLRSTVSTQSGATKTLVKNA